ncbi:MAG: formylmethanofuran--tetrahydromethanopterin N-formyltransferase, partial [Candidatus Bathyarchaeota archaeon]
AEMFGMWAGRVLVTAATAKWASVAAQTAAGFASSIIMSPAEAAVERSVLDRKTPDGRAGVIFQVYHRTRPDLKNQMILRISQCVMTCPTTAAFDALSKARRRIKVGRSLRLFGDGFQKKDVIDGRTVWRIPVMEGEFAVEDSFGITRAIAGGNLIIMARDDASGLQAAEKAVEAIRQASNGIIMPFPGGICRSGSKAGSLKYKLKASTNHPFCPSLRDLVTDSQLSEGVRCVYEIVINGLNLNLVKKAMVKGIEAAVEIPGVARISAGNYGGKLGPYHAYLKEILNLS